MRILLVEDEKGLIVTLTDRLRSEGFEVVSAADGKAGFDLASTVSFDLIILENHHQLISRVLSAGEIQLIRSLDQF